MFAFHSSPAFSAMRRCILCRENSENELQRFIRMLFPFESSEIRSNDSMQVANNADVVQSVSVALIPCGFSVAHVNSHVSLTFYFNIFSIDRFLVNNIRTFRFRCVCASLHFCACFQLLFDTKCNYFCIFIRSTDVFSYHFVPERK